jgi:hypothetical protein
MTTALSFPHGDIDHPFRGNDLFMKAHRLGFTHLKAAPQYGIFSYSH